MAIYNRISARRGQDVNLDATFYLGGQRADPFAIYRIEIFRGSVASENIVAAISIPAPSESSYPLPLVRQPDPPAANEACPTPPDCDDQLVGDGTDVSDGRFRLVWTVPTDVVVPDVYFDVWYFFSTDPGGSDLADSTDELLNQCNRFWIYPENWYVDGGLQTVNFGFEPLNIKFNKPERRPLEIGIMPLPLYDFNYNLVAPIIPFLTPTISIWTDSGEEVISNEQCTIGVRQGAFRTNPWVINYMLDTCRLFKGTYRYRVQVVLPDGTTRVSGDFYLTVS
jgi:hypothetical protein